MSQQILYLAKNMSHTTYSGENVLNIGSFEHRKLNRIGKDYIITIRICTVVVVLFFTRLQGACTALAKRELHWYLPNRVRQIPTKCGYVMMLLNICA